MSAIDQQISSDNNADVPLVDRDAATDWVGGDVSSRAFVDGLDPASARALTDQIRNTREALWDLIVRAYVERAWSALSYGSWDEYCTYEFGPGLPTLTRSQRPGVVEFLRQSGLSLRAIQSATGISRNTIIKDLDTQVVENEPPDADSVDLDEGDAADDGAAAGTTDVTPGGLSDQTPGMTDRVAAALARARAKLDPVLDPGPTPVIGVDGKRYRRKASKQSKPGPPQKRLKSIVSEIARALASLDKGVNRIVGLTSDQRFTGARGKIAELHLNELRRLGALIGEITDKIDDSGGCLPSVDRSLHHVGPEES